MGQAQYENRAEDEEDANSALRHSWFSDYLAWSQAACPPPSPQSNPKPCGFHLSMLPGGVPSTSVQSPSSVAMITTVFLLVNLLPFFLLCQAGG